MFLFAVRCQTRSKFSWSGAAFAAMFGAFAGRRSFGITRRVLMCIRIANELGRSAATVVRLTHPERPELIHRIATSSELDDVYAPIRVNRALMWRKSC